MTSFDNSLPMILNRTLDAIMPIYRELFARHHLTEQQWRVLRVLWTRGRATSAEISALTLLPAPSLVGIIDRLEKKGLVARLRSSSDRRQVHISTTPLGKALETQVVPSVEAIHEQVRSTVSRQEWDTMKTTLEKIAAHASARDVKRAGNE